VHFSDEWEQISISSNVEDTAERDKIHIFAKKED